jgi:hypothetical protein
MASVVFAHSRLRVHDVRTWPSMDAITVELNRLADGLEKWIHPLMVRYGRGKDCGGVKREADRCPASWLAELG